MTMEAGNLFQYYTTRTEKAQLVSLKTAMPLQYSVGVPFQVKSRWATKEVRWIEANASYKNP